MQSKTRLKAMNDLTLWIQHAINSKLPRFVTAATTIDNWITSILNSFGTPYTNEFTKGFNNTIKVLKRNAYVIVVLIDLEIISCIWIMQKVARKSFKPLLATII